MEKFFAKIILQVFRAQNLPWPEGLHMTDYLDQSEVLWCGGAPVQESVVRDFLHDWLAWEIENRIPKGDSTEKDSKDLPVHFLCKSLIWGPSDGTPKVELKIIIQSGELMLKIDPKVTKWKCPLFCTKTKIPLKLLHGPWTANRIFFLFALVDRWTNIDVKPETDREVEKQGLIEAIREDNYPAVWIIMGIWRRWNFRLQDSKMRLLLDIEHLRLAVVERECRKDIVECLLRFGFFSETEFDRPDPTLVGWAEKKIEQGDERGQWLLDELHRLSE